jgi:hypothetical protein
VKKMTWRDKFEKIKIGDTCICIRNEFRKVGNKGDNNGYGAGWEEGRVFKVREIDNKILWPEEYDYDDYDGSGIYLDCARKKI